MVECESKIEPAVGDELKCSASKNNLIAIGGENTQLQMFDIENPEKGATFKSKNCRPDKLQLHIPIHFTSVILPPKSESIVCTAYGSLTNQSHELRVYDPRAAMRRPVKRIEWERHPIISSCSLDQEGHKFALGNVRGKMAMIDLRQEKRVRPLKGAAGSVRSIVSHPDKPEVIGAVGLDRYLHIFDTKTCTRKQKVVHNLRFIASDFWIQIYLKSQLNSVIIEPGAALERKVQEVSKDDEEDDKDSNEIDDQENENIWKELDAAK